MLSSVRKDIQFMQMCFAGAAIFSTCAKRQYMAILVDDDDHVVGLGYNGGPKGSLHCKDGGCPRALQGSAPGSDYDNCISIHAEANALLHSDYNKATRLYVNGLPCFSCAKLIVNSGVSRVYIVIDPEYRYDNWDQVNEFLTENGVDVIEVEMNASR